MQSTILAQIEPLLRAQDFDIDYNKFLKYLSLLKRSKWIYPDALHRYTKSNIVDLYKALDFLEENSFVEQYVDIYCPNCKKFTGYCYKTIFEIPKEINCPHCDFYIDKVAEYAIVIYKLKG